VPLVVFDLDGTLIDSRLDLAESTNEMLSSYGANPLPVDEIAAMVGDGAKKLVLRALKAAGRRPETEEALHRFRAIYDRRLLNHTKPYDGVVDAVRDASALAALGVLTNKPAEPTHRLLASFGLAPLFRWVIGGDSGVPRKPDPAGLKQMMQHAGASADETLLVGDSMIDVLTARAAGVQICVARYGFGQLRGELELEPHELQVDAPAEIGRIIERHIRRLC
jgi:phosphoglycolate phosphatase